MVNSDRNYPLQEVTNVRVSRKKYLKVIAYTEGTTHNWLQISGFQYLRNFIIGV